MPPSSSAIPVLDPHPATSLAPPSTPAGRIHYLDNLRALAMMLGVFLHAGLAYAHPAQAIWLATDPSSSIFVDVSIWFIHLFRMSLFFLLSGYFAKVMLDRYGTRSFLWKRTVRLVIPFLLFYPFLFVSMMAVIVFALGYLPSPSGLMGIIAEASRPGASNQEKPPPTTMHLWFLYYLVMFSGLGAALDRLSWFQWPSHWKSPWIGLAIPALLIPAALAAGAPLPAPESFIPSWWPFAFYGLFFWAGWQWVGSEATIDHLLPYRWPLAIACIALFVLYYQTIPTLDLSMITQKDLQLPLRNQLLCSLLTSYLTVGLTLLAILFGKQWLNRRRFGLRFLADASYWIYLVHLPIVLFLQTLLIPLPWPWSAKLAIVLLVTLGLSLGSYVTFVRYTPLGWLLHGKRDFP